MRKWTVIESVEKVIPLPSAVGIRYFYHTRDRRASYPKTAASFLEIY
jgi:hypothetical protein